MLKSAIEKSMKRNIRFFSKITMQYRTPCSPLCLFKGISIKPQLLVGKEVKLKPAGYHLSLKQSANEAV